MWRGPEEQQKIWCSAPMRRERAAQPDEGGPPAAAHPHTFERHESVTSTKQGRGSFGNGDARRRSSL
jgi:hypothetical protein